MNGTEDEGEGGGDEDEDDDLRDGWELAGLELDGHGCIGRLEHTAFVRFFLFSSSLL